VRSASELTVGEERPAGKLKLCWPAVDHTGAQRRARGRCKCADAISAFFPGWTNIAPLDSTVADIIRSLKRGDLHVRNRSTGSSRSRLRTPGEPVGVRMLPLLFDVGGATLMIADRALALLRSLRRYRERRLANDCAHRRRSLDDHSVPRFRCASFNRSRALTRAQRARR